jgi:hypothetical protein
VQAANHRQSGIWRGAYLSEHGTLVPMKHAMNFGTEVPCLENNNLGFVDPALFYANA